MSLEPRSIPEISDRPLLLTSKELHRMREQIEHDARVQEEHKAHCAETQRLKDASAKMVDTWKNTFKGFQRQRMEEVRKRETENEIRRVHMDIMEEKVRERRRQEVLDLAFKRLYEQTDRVKRLTAAKHFAETLKEREEQQETKKRADAVFNRYDAEYIKCVLRDMDRYQDELQERARRDKAMKAENAENWNEQIREAEMKRKEERKEENRQGFVIKDEAARFFQEDLDAMRKRKQQQDEFRKMLDYEVETKQKIQHMHKVMEDADDRQAQLFIDAKQRMKDLQKQRQREEEEKRQQREAKIAKSLTDRSAKMKRKEEANCKKAVLEIEAKEREESQLKNLKRAEELASIEEFYKNELKAKEERKLAEKRQKFNERRGLIELEEQLNKIEDAKLERWATGEKEAQQFQLQQMANKEKDNKTGKIEELNEYMRHMRSLDEEEEFFQKYARLMIESCERKGLDTYAMKKVAEPGVGGGKGPLFIDRGKIRPKYLAAVADADDLHYVKKTSNVVDTKTRLGFAK